jgi:hypothetical protein
MGSMYVCSKYLVYVCIQGEQQVKELYYGSEVNAVMYSLRRVRKYIVNW